MKEMEILRKAGYIKPEIKKVVLTSNERMAGTCGDPVGSVPPSECGEAAASWKLDTPIS